MNIYRWSQVACIVLVALSTYWILKGGTAMAMVGCVVFFLALCGVALFGRPGMPLFGPTVDEDGLDIKTNVAWDIGLSSNDIPRRGKRVLTKKGEKILATKPMNMQQVYA